MTSFIRQTKVLSSNIFQMQKCSQSSILKQDFGS